MKITIDVDAIAGLQNEALFTPTIPIPPPELLKRAKALGAISAGPANFGRAHTALPDLDVAPAVARKRAVKKKVAKRASRRTPR